MPALIQFQSGLDSRTTPIQSLGIASPCSTCTNRNSLPKAGYPACPRAVLLQQQQDAINNGTDFTDYEHLTLSGLEANPFATPAPGVFANPVYDEGNNSLYVWVARLVDNQGGMNPDRSVAFPPITDPTFLTTYTSHIQCMALPMVPSDTLAQYYNKGRIKEGELVMISAYEGQQIDSNGDVEVYGGSVSKVATHKFFPVTSRPTKDDHPRGS